MILTSAEKKMLIAMLELAGDELSHNGCNDFDLRTVVPDRQERDNIVLGYCLWADGDDEYYKPASLTETQDYRMMDWEICKYLLERIKEDT